MAATGSVSIGLITASAPNSLARARRAGLTSSAITRAPRAEASWVADRPTGPWPKIAMVWSPVSSRRFNAPQAVPVPQEMAAPVSNDSSSGSCTSVFAGHFM